MLACLDGRHTETRKAQRKHQKSAGGHGGRLETSSNPPAHFCIDVISGAQSENESHSKNMATPEELLRAHCKSRFSLSRFRCTAAALRNCTRGIAALARFAQSPGFRKYISPTASYPRWPHQKNRPAVSRSSFACYIHRFSSETLIFFSRIENLRPPSVCPRACTFTLAAAGVISSATAISLIGISSSARISSAARDRSPAVLQLCQRPLQIPCLCSGGLWHTSSLGPCAFPSSPALRQPWAPLQVAVNIPCNCEEIALHVSSECDPRVDPDAQESL